MWYATKASQDFGASLNDLDRCFPMLAGPVSSKLLVEAFQKSQNKINFNLKLYFKK